MAAPRGRTGRCEMTTPLRVRWLVEVRAFQRWVAPDAPARSDHVPLIVDIDHPMGGNKDQQSTKTAGQGLAGRR